MAVAQPHVGSRPGRRRPVRPAVEDPTDGATEAPRREATALDAELERAERLEQDLLHGGRVTRLVARARLAQSSLLVDGVAAPGPDPSPVTPSDLARSGVDHDPTVPVGPDAPDPTARREDGNIPPDAHRAHVDATSTPLPDPPTDLSASVGPAPRAVRPGPRRPPKRSVTPAPVPVAARPAGRPDVIAGVEQRTGTDATPADVADSRLGDRSTPTETFGSHRLDLRTDEAAKPVAADTPAPLTARGLASVRREAGVGRFPDGRNQLGDDDGWETWAEGLANDDGRLAQLDDDLGRHTSRLTRYAMRLLSPRRERGAEPTGGD